MRQKYGFIFKENSEKSLDYVTRDIQAISSSYTRSYGFVPVAGKGAVLWDADGDEYLDLAAGIAVMSTGHTHPHVIDAVKNQLDNLVHIGGTDFFPTRQIELAEKLQQIIPIKDADEPGQKRVHIVNTGSGANETAIKLARYQQGGRERRNVILAFYGAFHGRTYGSLSLTASKAIQRSNFSHIPDGVIHLPYPGKHAYDRATPAQRQMIEFDTVKFIKKYIFKKISPDQIAAIFVEPIQGEGGYIVPVDHFFPSLRQLCDAYGILLIVDEIQSGIGRTGKWTAIEHWGVKPDIVTLAKGLGSGFQIGAVVAHENIMNWLPGSHASTFSGHEVSCRAAIATLEVVENEDLMANVRKVSRQAFDRLKQIQAAFPDVIYRIDGKGLMIGIEFADEQGHPLARLRNQVVENCFLANIITLGAGKSTLRLAPPLTITADQMQQGLDGLEEAIRQALQEPDPGQATPGLKPRVLIIEDERMVRKQIATVVEQTMGDVEIIEADDVVSARYLLETTPSFALITLDNSLTDEKVDSKGLELLPYLEPHVHENHTPVIAFSGTLSMSDFKRFVIHGILSDIVDKREKNARQQLQEAICNVLQRTTT